MKIIIGKLRNYSTSQILAVALLAASPVHISADVTTAITPNGLDTTVTQNGSTFDINGGKIVGGGGGTNQFHSFSQFDVGTGNIANFMGPTSIVNILSRVTGGQISMIDGTIKSSINGANLWFINPNGVVFGPNASLNITGSLHVSSADSLSDGNGGMFYANPTTDPTNALLFVNDPTSFGFLGTTNGSISVGIPNNFGPNLQVQPGETISLVGSQVLLDSSSLTAEAGRLNLVSVGNSVGTVSLDDGITTSGITYSGSGEQVSLDNSELNTDGPGGGSVFIRGGQFVMVGDTVNISANTTGPSNGGVIDIEVANSAELGDISAKNDGVGIGGDITNGGDITISVTEPLGIVNIGGAHIETKTDAGNAGSVTIIADVIFSGSGARIDVSSETGSSGDAGDVTLRGFGSGSSLDLFNSTVSADSKGAGSGGNITIDMSGPVSLGGTFNTFNSSSSNVAGNIQIQGETIKSKNGGFSVNAVNKGSGTGGDISINATESIVFEQFFFEAGTTGIGTGGIVTISAPSVILTKATSTGASEVWSNTFGSGYAGEITLRGDYVEVSNGATVKAETRSKGGGEGGDGTAGKIVIDLDYYQTGNQGELVLASGSSISSSASIKTTGDAGNIEIKNASRVEINDGTISTSTIGIGDAGTITLSNIDEVMISRGGQIKSTTNDVGQAGNVQFADVDHLTLNNDEFLGVIEDEISTSTTGAGNAGIISFSNTADTTISGTGKITSTTESAGEAGRIEFNGPGNITVDGVEVSTKSLAAASGSEIGGSISIAGNNFELANGATLVASTEGSRAAGNIDINLVGQLDVSAGTSVESTTNGVGAAGAIAINTPILKIDGEISTRTTGAGEAGTISFSNPADTSISGTGQITSTTDSTGKAGNIEFNGPGNVTLDSVRVSAESLAVASIDDGDGGSILVNGNDFTLTNGATLSANTKGVGAGGNVAIDVDNFRMNSGGLVEVNAEGNADAGSINIFATDSISMENSSITSSAQNSNGGDITVAANNLMFLVENTIKAEADGSGTSKAKVLGKEVTGGNIRLGTDIPGVSPVFLILQKNTISANAVGNGGNISIFGQNLLGGENEITATGDQGNDGEIIFDSQTDDLVDVVTLLDIPFLNIASVLNNRCAVNAIKDRSSFVIEGAGLPPAPDRYAPSNFNLAANTNLPQQTMGWTNESQLAINFPIDTNECQ